VRKPLSVNWNIIDETGVLCIHCPMASKSDLTRLAQQDQNAELQLPAFPKLSDHAPSLARIAPKEVAAWEQAIEQFMKNTVFNIRGGQ
jgi:hypothetical protein